MTSEYCRPLIPLLPLSPPIPSKGPPYQSIPPVYGTTDRRDRFAPVGCPGPLWAVAETVGAVVRRRAKSGRIYRIYKQSSIGAINDAVASLPSGRVSLAECTGDFSAALAVRRHPVPSCGRDRDAGDVTPDPPGRTVRFVPRIGGLAPVPSVVCDAITAGCGVLGSFLVGPEWDDAGRYSGGDAPPIRPPAGPAVPMVLQITGWDDSRSSWRVVNHLDTCWGVDGNGWLTYLSLLIPQSCLELIVVDVSIQVEAHCHGEAGEEDGPTGCE